LLEQPNPLYKWIRFIKESGRSKKLDLRDVMNKWKNAPDREMKEKDPILYLQLQSLAYDPAYRDYDLISMRSISDYIDDGKDPIVHVTTKPITGYSAKSPEEAFCEAFGMLVGYGTKVLLPQVVFVLRTILPGIRLESVVELFGTLLIGGCCNET